MNVLFATIADHASADQQGGKLNVNGIFDRIGAPKFPAQHALMYLVVRFMFEYEDGGRPHAVEIVLQDADHNVFLNATGEITPPQVAPGNFITLNNILELRNLVFANPGRYVFTIKADGKEMFRLPFDLHLVK